MAQEVTTVFGSWLPALAAAQTSQKRTDHQETDNGQGMPNKRPRQTRRGQRGGGGRGRKVENVEEIVAIMAALTLQQEDSLNRLRLDTAHTFHLTQSGPGSVLKALFSAGQAWQEKKGKGEPLPALRTVIFGLLVAETQARMTLFDKDEAAIKAAQESQILTSDKLFVYQRWNPMTQKLEPDPERLGLAAEEVLQTLQELGKLCTDNVITKFNAVRKMKKEPEENDKAVFIVEVSIRSPAANRAQELIAKLANCTVWSLVAAQLRPPTLKRHGLAAALQKALDAE